MPDGIPKHIKRRKKTFAEKSLTSREKKLLDMYNKAVDPDVSVGESAWGFGSFHADDKYKDLTQKILDTAFNTRSPVIRLGDDRHNWFKTQRAAEGGIRTVGDVVHDEAWVLAHELGHALDFQSEENRKPPLKEIGRYASEQDVKALDKILQKLKGNQYDLRQLKKRSTQQLFADDLGRSLLYKMENMEQHSTYKKAVQKYAENIMKSR